MSTVGSEERKLLAQAAEWRLLSILFEYPSAGWHDRLSAIEADIDDPRLLEAAEAAKEQASEGIHHSIFGPGGPVSPREATYTNGVQLGYLLAELSAFYSAFAYAPVTPEPADHVAIEAGFIAYLRVKQAYALASGNAEQAAVTEHAAADFLGEHLRTMAEPVAQALESVAPPYLAMAGKLLLERAGPRATPFVPSYAGADDADGCATDSPLVELSGWPTKG